MDKEGGDGSGVLILEERVVREAPTLEKMTLNSKVLKELRVRVSYEYRRSSILSRGTSLCKDPKIGVYPAFSGNPWEQRRE